MKIKSLTIMTGTKSLLVLCAAIAFAMAPSKLSAQNVGWEGETGVFVTPLAYTAASTSKGLGRPVVAYHFLNGGDVLGDFYQVSVMAGAFGRTEFSYTRSFHTLGNVPALSPLWHNGFNTFHGKVNVVGENAGKHAWMPAVSLGFMVRSQVRNVGAALTGKSMTNGDVYLVASKTITQTKVVPVILSGGIRGTNAELFGMGGNAPGFTERAFGAVAFVVKGPAHSSLIFGSEVSQQPKHPDQLPNAIIPTTLTYAVRLVPVPEHKINIDFGVAQVAGKIAPGVDLHARARIGAQLSYAF